MSLPTRPSWKITSTFQIPAALLRPRAPVQRCEMLSALRTGMATRRQCMRAMITPKFIRIRICPKAYRFLVRRAPKSRHSRPRCLPLCLGLAVTGRAWDRLHRLHYTQTRDWTNGQPSRANEHIDSMGQWATSNKMLLRHVRDRKPKGAHAEDEGPCISRRVGL